MVLISLLKAIKHCKLAVNAKGELHTMKARRCVAINHANRDIWLFKSFHTIHKENGR